MKTSRKVCRWTSYTWKTEAQIANAIKVIDKLYMENEDYKKDDAFLTALMLLRHATIQREAD